MDIIMSKDEERFYLDRFIELFNDFPNGDISPNESPDFIIEGLNKTYGIELSSIYQNIDYFGNKIQAIDSIVLSVNDMISQKLKMYQIPFLDVSITYTLKKLYSKKQRDILSNKIVGLIINNVPQTGDWISMEYNYNSKTFIPREVTILRIANFQFNDQHYVRSPRSGWVQEDMIHEIQEAIDRKNKKRMSYISSCHEHWLLLHSVVFSSASFFNPSKETLSHKYKCNFDRLFLLICSPYKLYELQIE